VTGPCSGAVVGVPRPGFADFQYVGPAAIGGALAGLSGWAGAGVGAAIGALTYDLSTFCPNGPPAMPTFSAADIAALLSPIDFGGRTAAALKFNDFIGNLFWDRLCECPGGTTTIGSPSSYPSGAGQVVNVPQGVLVCKEINLPQQNYGTSSVTPYYYGTGTASTTIDDVGIPAGATQMSVIMTAHSVGASHYSGSGTFQFRNASHTAMTSVSGSVASAGSPGGAAGPLTGSIAVPAGAVYLRIQIGKDTAGTVTDQFSANVKLYCNGLPGQTLASCCAPDPGTQMLLEQILSMVTLVQRQSAPFAYVYGANHTALSGDGEITVFGLIGVSVDVTTLPSYYGSADGSPVKHFGLGYVQLGTADGYDHSRQVDFDGTLMIPPVAGAFTKIGYSLSPGVVVSIRELVREP